MRLYLFQLGIISTGEPIIGYLVQTEGGQRVLIDTGYRPGTLGESEDDVAFLHASPDQLVENRLEQIGLLPSDIDYVIVTHLDPDHAGFVGSFPRAELIIQRRHLALARESDAPRFRLTRPAWEGRLLKFREVDGDAEVLPGIRVIETSGHVTGHQSVLLRLPNTGSVLLPVDAMAQEHITAPDERVAGPFDEDEAQLRQSTRKLVDLAAREQAQIIYAHDAVQWASLRHSPEYYD